MAIKKINEIISSTEDIQLESFDTKISMEVNTSSFRPKLDKLGRSYATGRRKVASARVWIKNGGGRFTINNRSSEDFFKLDQLLSEINKPFVVSGMLGKFDVLCTVKGGGTSGQAGAIKLAIARALVGMNPAMRSTIAGYGFLKRDPRMVESKKYGRHGARRGTQFVKR